MEVPMQDAWLFQTPADLICPITHELVNGESTATPPAWPSIAPPARNPS